MNGTHLPLQSYPQPLPGKPNPIFSTATLISMLQWIKYKISTILLIRYRLLVTLVVVVSICLYLCLQAIHTDRVMSVYRSPINMTHQSTHKQFYTSSYADFLQNQNVRTLMQIQCTLNCFVSLRQQQLKPFDVRYVDYLHQIHVDKQEVDMYADWVNYYGPELHLMTNQQIRAQAHKLRRISRLGLAIIWEYSQLNRISRYQMTRIRSIFESKNLSYNTIESLQLRRIQGRVIEIYTRFSRPSQTFDRNPNEYNLMAIQTEIKLQRDIPFLREWIGYHTTLGVDKFFIYRLPDDHQECSGLTTSEIEAEWAKIWADYATSIVYIPWRPLYVSLPFPLNLLFPSLPSTQHDYIYNFGKEISYTIFLSSDSLIFSKIGLKLSKNLKQMTRFDSFQLETRHFVQRYCTNSKLMIQNYQYYDYGNAHTPSNRIFSTYLYQPEWGHTGGYLSLRNTHTFGNQQWRVNKYSFSKNDLKKVQATQKYPNMYLSFDYSAEPRVKLALRISDRYAITSQQNCYADGLDCVNPHGKII